VKRQLRAASVVVLANWHGVSADTTASARNSMGAGKQQSMSRAANNALSLSRMTDSESRGTRNDTQKRSTAIGVIMIKRFFCKKGQIDSQGNLF